MSYLLILEWSQSTPVGLWNTACSLRKASGLVSTEMRLSPQSGCFHNWRPSKSRSWKFEFQKHKYDCFHPSEQRACHPSRDLPLRLGSRGWSWWSVDLDSSSSLDTTPPSKCSASHIVDGFRCVSSLNLPLKITLNALINHLEKTNISYSIWLHVRWRVMEHNKRREQRWSLYSLGVHVVWA